jgi:hypothetical protein
LYNLRSLISCTIKIIYYLNTFFFPLESIWGRWRNKEGEKRKEGEEGRRESERERRERERSKDKDIHRK